MTAIRKIEFQTRQNSRVKGDRAPHNDVHRPSLCGTLAGYAAVSRHEFCNTQSVVPLHRVRSLSTLPYVRENFELGEGRIVTSGILPIATAVSRRRA